MKSRADAVVEEISRAWEVLSKQRRIAKIKARLDAVKIKAAQQNPTKPTDNTDFIGLCKEMRRKEKEMVVLDGKVLSIGEAVAEACGPISEGEDGVTLRDNIDQDFPVKFDEGGST